MVGSKNVTNERGGGLTASVIAASSALAVRVDGEAPIK